MKHNEVENCLQESKYITTDDWHIAGLGETLERNFKCTVCNRSWREVYIHSCTIENSTEEIVCEY